MLWPGLVLVCPASSRVWWDVPRIGNISMGRTDLGTYRTNIDSWNFPPVPFGSELMNTHVHINWVYIPLTHFYLASNALLQTNHINFIHDNPDRKERKKQCSQKINNDNNNNNNNPIQSINPKSLSFLLRPRKHRKRMTFCAEYPSIQW